MTEWEKSVLTNRERTFRCIKTLIASDAIPHFRGQILKCLRPRNQRRHNNGSACLCRLIPDLFGAGLLRQRLFGLILLHSHADDKKGMVLTPENHLPCPFFIVHRAFSYISSVKSGWSVTNPSTKEMSLSASNISQK